MPDQGWTATLAGALRELKFAAAYGASKSGVISLSRTTAIEYGADKIQCNGLCPGSILTPMTLPMLQNQDVAAHLRETVPWGEGGLTRGPEEIAHAAVWLASEEAGWVTGVILPVDGGFAIHP
ncbi:hypothetical protein QBC43DRAFT_291963 [Cladorrhinum sp. PSN259]|nr:hypothetical protein QBC43DRAFT_291963 [Cladorrhinum sp. PSN259]